MRCFFYTDGDMEQGLEDIPVGEPWAAALSHHSPLSTLQPINDLNMGKKSSDLSQKWNFN